MSRTLSTGWVARAIAVSALLSACSSAENSNVSGDSGPSSVQEAGASSTPSETGVTDGPVAGSTTAPTFGSMPEALACEHTGGGIEYGVGPDQAYAAIGDVPWATLAAGDTVRIFWRDEPYREKFLLQGHGTKDQPGSLSTSPKFAA